MPASIGLGVLQYRGIFHRNHQAAKTTGTVLSVTGALMVLGVGSFLKESFTNPEILYSWPTAMAIFVLGLFFILVGWWNLEWSRNLKADVTSTEVWPRFERDNRRDRIAALLAVIVIILGTSLTVWSALPEFAENVEYSRPPFGIPIGATSISFCQGQRGTIAYEFSIEEPDFRKWIERKIHSRETNNPQDLIKSILSSSPISVRRYVSLKTGLKGNPSAVVTDGLYYSWSKEDQGMDAVFDRKAKRAYYFSHYY